MCVCWHVDFTRVFWISRCEFCVQARGLMRVILLPCRRPAGTYLGRLQDYCGICIGLMSAFHAFRDAQLLDFCGIYFEEDYGPHSQPSRENK